MELQVALDRIPLGRAVQIATQVSPYVDWVEMGTSLIKQYGVAGLAEVVEAARPTPVLADLKTVDDVQFELSLAYGAGARSATVLGMAPSVTIDWALAVSAERGRELMIDLMSMEAGSIELLAQRVPRSVVLAAHVGKDAQGSAARPEEQLGGWSSGRRIALAGGISGADLPRLSCWPDLRVIVGSAVSGAHDPLSAVLDLRAASGKPLPSGKDADGD